MLARTEWITWLESLLALYSGLLGQGLPFLIFSRVGPTITTSLAREFRFLGVLLKGNTKRLKI